MGTKGAIAVDSLTLNELLWFNGLYFVIGY